MIEKLGRFDVVYHAAAEFGRWNGEDFYESLWRTNAVGTKNVIRLEGMRSGSGGLTCSCAVALPDARSAANNIHRYVLFMAASVDRKAVEHADSVRPVQRGLTATRRAV